jgi:hypothetical protein
MHQPRNLSQIAQEICSLWRKDAPSTNVRLYASPYVQAMLQIHTCADMYGAEYGDMVVAHALCNLNGWRGEDARRIKAELNAHLEEHNNARDSSQKRE